MHEALRKMLLKNLTEAQRTLSAQCEALQNDLVKNEPGVARLKEQIGCASATVANAIREFESTN